MPITAIADDQFPWATTIEDLLNFWTPGQGNGLSTFGAALDRLNVVAADVEVDALVDGDTPGNRAKINAIIAALDIPEGAAFYGDLLAGRYYRTAQPSCVRASPAYAPDLAGVYQAFGNDELRLTDAGLYVPEGARTNFITGTDMAAVVPGTPGIAPSGWSFPNSAVGLSREIVGSGTAHGLPYVDVRYSGTATGAGLYLNFAQSTSIPALPGQVWAWSAFLEGISGSIPQAVFGMAQRGTGGAAIPGDIIGSQFSTAEFIRRSTIGTLTDPSTEYVLPYLRFSLTVDVVYEFTFRIYAAQMEGDEVSSPIITAGSAATRAADTVTIAAPAGTFDLHLMLDDATEEVIPGFQDGDALPLDLPQGKNIVKYWGVEA